MSYTVGIHAQHQLDGSRVFFALDQTSALVRVPNDFRAAEGYIQNGNRTCVGAIWLPANNTVIREVETRLHQQLEGTNSKFALREVSMGPHKLALLNLLYEGTEGADLSFMFLSDVFKGVKSKTWLLENTAWWKTFEEDALLCAPRIVDIGNGRRIAYLSVGAITDYFVGNYDNGDKRGVSFREAHSDTHISELPNVMLRELITESNYNYGEAFRRFTDNQEVGMKHLYTVAYFDELNEDLRVAHMTHELFKDTYKHVTAVDKEGTVFAVTREPVLRNLSKVWDGLDINSIQTIEGPYIKTIRETSTTGIERR